MNAFDLLDYPNFGNNRKPNHIKKTNSIYTKKNSKMQQYLPNFDTILILEF